MYTARKNYRLGNSHILKDILSHLNVFYCSKFLFTLPFCPTFVIRELRCTIFLYNHNKCIKHLQKQYSPEFKYYFILKCFKVSFNQVSFCDFFLDIKREAFAHCYSINYISINKVCFIRISLF